LGRHINDALRDGVDLTGTTPDDDDDECSIAWGYLRVSSVRQQKSGLSISEQADRIIRYCAENKLDLGKETMLDKERNVQFHERLCEEQESAFSKPFCSRPVGKELNHRMEQGHNLVIALCDRGFRDGLDALNTVDMWHRRGVKVHILDMAGDITVLPGKMMFAMLAYAAEWESFRKSERQYASHAAAKRKGSPSINFAPLGYKFSHRPGSAARKLVPFPQEVEQCRKIFLWHQGGMNAERIASRCLRERVKRIDKRFEGSTAPYTEDWHPSAIKKAIYYWYEVCYFRAQGDGVPIDQAVKDWLAAYLQDRLPPAEEIQKQLDAYKRRKGRDICQIEDVQ
jgi:DNA invertase Pin-like site-specific DNA recombinase